MSEQRRESAAGLPEDSALPASWPNPIAPGTCLHIRVPATSANLGPGFDSLALALQLYNRLDIEVLAADKGGSLRITGEGANRLGQGEENLVLTAMQSLAQAADRALPPLAMDMHNDIPLGRGLGSSAAAIAAGLLAAAVLLGEPAVPEALLRVGLPLEGHPDNIAAVLWGGFTVGVVHQGQGVVQRLQPPDGLQAVILIPDQYSSTTISRAALPVQLTRADAVFNAGRVGMLVAAIALNQLDLLRVAMEDRMHQPARAREFAYLPGAIEAALAAGAHGAALSGAGSSVIALASNHLTAVAAAMEAEAARWYLPARVLVLSLDTAGAECRLGT
jgi:homoserine kinase